MHVLVVDDEPSIGQWLTVMLELEDIEVSVAEENFDALLTAEPWTGIDVAIVDLMLPGATGAAILAWLAAHLPKIRRVAFSASAVGLAALPIGAAHAYLLKGNTTTPQILAALRAG